MINHKSIQKDKPVKQLLYISKSFNATKDPIVDGIVPIRKLCEYSTIFILRFNQPCKQFA